MHDLAQQFVSHLKAIWRYRWYAIVSAWILAIAGWIAVYNLPEKHEASARLFVDTQSVLRPLLSGLAVQPNLDQIVAMMSQTLISDPNLEAVIRMSGLNEGTHPDADKAKMLARLREEISVKGTGKENLYAITVVDKDPEAAKRIVQSLLTIFVEGSLTGNRKDSDSARSFIDEQLKGYRDKLVAAEESITAFKRRHMGLMPGEGPGYFAQLNEAKAALNRATLDLREAENSRDSIRKRLATESEMSISVLPAERSAATAAPETELDRRIFALEQKLDNLRLSYTEQHPDIVAAISNLAQLKEQRRLEEEKLREQLAAQGKPEEPRAAVLQARNPVYQQLALQLTSAEANVAVMHTRVSEYNRRYAELQASANAMPQVEAEYAQLTRDYEVNKARYAELLKRRDSAQISGDMGESHAGITFRVIEPPRVVALTPHPKLLMSGVLLAALLGGMGIAYLVGQLKHTINDERSLRHISGLRVLGTVVMNMTDAQRLQHRRGLAAFSVVLMGLLSVYGAIMAGVLLSTTGV